jgi:hypothetical protein
MGFSGLIRLMKLVSYLVPVIFVYGNLGNSLLIKLSTRRFYIKYCVQSLFKSIFYKVRKCLVIMCFKSPNKQITNLH